MMRSKRRGLFWSLVLAYAVGSVLWILHVPHAPEKLLKAVPGSATIISMHENLAGRWSDIADHPVAIMASSAFGVDSEDWEELDDDPGFQYLLNLLGRRELITAYVPYAGADYQPAWVLASWIGGRSHRLRWTVPFIPIKGLERAEDIGNWPVWIYKFDDEEDADEIQLVLVEGMIIGCMSTDPTAIETVIESYNGIYPSVASREDLGEWTRKLLEADGKDRIWYQNKASGVSEMLSGPILAEIDLGDTNNVKGRAVLPSPEILSQQDEPVDLTKLASLWQNHPIAIAAASAAAVYQFDDLPENPYAEAVMDVLRETEGTALTLGLFGEDYSGRLMGVKIPTIMAAVQVPESAELRVTVNKLADHYNAKHQLGVVPVLYLAGTTIVYRLEGTANNFYASFDASEQFAFVRNGNWIVGSSNLKALEKLIGQPQAEAAEQETLEWASKASGSFDRNGRIFFSTDLQRANATLRLAISAYSLKLLFEDPSGSKEQRQALNEAKAWLEILAQLGQLYVYSEVDKEEATVTFEAGL